MGEMADHDREMFEDEERDPKLAYLKWIRERLLTRANPGYIHCRKYPEFGMIWKDEIDQVIEDYKLVRDYGPQDDAPLKATIQAAAYGMLSPDKLTGKTVYMSDVQQEILDRLAKKMNERNNMFDTEALRREARLLLQQADAMDGVPQNDLFQDGQVITFKKKFNTGRAYSYAAVKVAAIRAGEYWYTTSQRPGALMGRLSWYGLLEGIGVENLYTIEVLDVDSSIPLKEWVKGVQEALEAEIEMPPAVQDAAE